MSVLRYLESVASTSVIREPEISSINNSINHLQRCLNSHFGSSASEHFIFGSYTRGTILPRSMDLNSDIDYMIVFQDSSYRPQTYLNWLRSFVEKYYRQSEIHQSSPTIVLELNHIKFELVPAIDNWFLGYQIPAKPSAFADWISTDPNSFNTELIEKNNYHNYNIKPLIRVTKYWNALNNHIYDSYSLEKYIIDYPNWDLMSLFQSLNLKEYFYSLIESLELPYNSAEWRKNSLNRAKESIEQAKFFEACGNSTLAEQEIKKLILEPVLVR